MTRCSLHSDDLVRYASTVRRESVCMPGVSYSIYRMSYGRRCELLRRIRDLGRRAEYLNAGSEAGDKLDASLAGSEIDAAYLRWGLQEVTGLLIDGEPAGHDLLLERGPESLVREMLSAIRAECGLNPEETKN